MFGICVLFKMNLNEIFRDLDFIFGFKIFVIIFLILELIFGVVFSIMVLFIYWNKRYIWNVVLKFIVNFVVIDFVICCVCILLIIVCLVRFFWVLVLLCLCYEVLSLGLRNFLFVIFLFICYDCYKFIISFFVLRLNYWSVKCVLIFVWFLIILSFVLFFIEWIKIENLWFLVCIVLFCKL